MQLSHYARIFSLPDNPAQRLVYSTRTGAVALVPLDDLAAVESGTIDPESAQALAELGLLVQDRNQEKREALDLVKELNRLRTAMNVSVVVNLHCNFRCRYCFEGSRKEKSFMDKATAERLVEFIQDRFQPGMSRLTLDFYGGEPLLSIGLIKKIAGPLKSFVESRGVLFEITLVTNGSLLTAKNVGTLLPMGLKRAKVTVDGPPEIHNLSRPYRSGRPSFATILKNLGECAELINVAINGNFTRDNYHRFPELFDYLTAYGLTPERLYRMNFAPVMQVTDEFSTGFCGGCVTCNEPWLSEAAPFLRGELLKRGYRTDEIAPSLCMVDVDNSFVVHYDGTLYKCVALIGHREYACGDVWSGMKDYRRQYHLDHWRREENCRECVYLPLCFGGCRYMAFQRNGHMAEVDCWKPFLDASLEATLLQDVRYWHQA